MTTIADDLRKYALAKPGTELNVDDHVRIIREERSNVLQIYDAPRDYALVPVSHARKSELIEQYSWIAESKWMDRDGHSFVTFPTDDTVDMEVVRQIIDEGYKIAMDKLDDLERAVVMTSGRDYVEDEILAELCDLYDLSQHLDSIKRISKKALLLKSVKTAEKNISVGGSKIGGKPDVPADFEWPIHTDGKPFAFIAQLNLEDVAATNHSFAGLPKSGLMLLFSVWGWTDPDNGFQMPDGPVTEEWNCLAFVSDTDSLERRRKPKGVNQFKAAALEFCEFRSLPHNPDDPSVQQQQWDDETKDRFDRLVLTLTQIRNHHYAPKLHGSWHQFGGFGHFQHGTPESICDGSQRLLLQIGTDDYTSNMMWGDGGELYFTANQSDSVGSGIAGLKVDCQGG